MPNCPHILSLRQLLRMDSCWSADLAETFCFSMHQNPYQFDVNANVSEMLYNLSAAQTRWLWCFLCRSHVTFPSYLDDRKLSQSELKIWNIGSSLRFIFFSGYHQTSSKLILNYVYESIFQRKKMGRFWFSWLTFLWSIKPNYSETFTSFAPIRSLSDSDMIIPAQDNILSFQREMSPLCAKCPVGCGAQWSTGQAAVPPLTPLSLSGLSLVPCTGVPGMRR